MQAASNRPDAADRRFEPPGRPTILQIIPRLDTGGAEMSAIEVTEAIVAAGGRALVATEGGRMANRVTRAGGQLITFAAATKNPARILLNARRLRALFARENVSLVHARSRAPAWSALLAARRAGIPFVTTYHGAYSENGSLKRLYNSVMARADIVIANSAYTAALIRSRYDAPQSRIRVIHRGIDPAQFEPAAVAPERVAALRRAWGITSGTPVILLAARLTSWKGQGILIEAAGRLRERGRLGSAIVVLAGDAQGRAGYAEDLEAQIAAQGLEDRVKLVGHVDDMAAALLTAHVAVVASVEPEGFGRVAIEAQAMGCPVISTDIGAPPETVIAAPAASADTVTGWLMPPGDPEALAQHLTAALALGCTARNLIGDRARLHVRQNFTLDAMKRATLGVYDELLASSLASQFRADGTRPSGPA